jgi:hypothetical protein
MAGMQDKFDCELLAAFKAAKKHQGNLERT